MLQFSSTKHVELLLPTSVVIYNTDFIDCELISFLKRSKISYSSLGKGSPPSTMQVVCIKVENGTLTICALITVKA